MSPQNDDASLDEFSQVRAMLDASVDCIKCVGLDGTIIRMNRSGCLALGAPPETGGRGLKWLSLLPADVRRQGQRAFRAAAEGRKASFAGRSQLPGQRKILWDNILTPIFDGEGRVKAILCLSRNVTYQREAERRLRLASDHDALTGIPNRRSFGRHAAGALRKAAAAGLSLGLLLIDLDNFKAINDSAGHDVGDHVLQQVARRLDRARRNNEFVARLGGDEFAVTIPGVRDGSDLADFVARFQTLLASPVLHRGRRYEMRVSIGGAIARPGLESLAELMKASDIALYAVKSAGRNGFELFEAA